MGKEAAPTDRQAGRCGGGARVARTSIQPQTAGQDTATSAGDPEAAGLARLWADVRRRTIGQAPPNPGGQRDAARLDDRGRDVEEPAARASGRASVATAAKRVRRVSPVGHVGTRLAGGERTRAISGADDR